MRAHVNYLCVWRFYYKTIIFLFVMTHILCVNVYEISDNNTSYYVHIQ